MAWNPGLRLLSHERAQNHSQSIILALKVDTLSIKSMMTEMYQVFKGQSFLSPLHSVIFTLALTYILTNVEGENEPNTATEDISSLTGEEPDANKQEKPKEPKHSIDANIEFIESKYEIFFTDEFGDQAFRRWSNINKVGMKALISYLVVDSMVQSPKNTRFNMKLKKLIAEHPDQEKLKSKKVKLEALGYEMD
nr:hypothetical protein [Tanacetum cinerariifolium]